MYFLKLHYKIYDWSKLGSALSILGAIFLGWSWISLFSIVALLIGIPSASNPNYISDIKFIIPIVIVAGIILSIISSLLQKKADKVSDVAFENKVRNDFKFAKKMAKNNPENKKWYIDRNSEYADYVLSGREDFEIDEEDSSIPKKKSIWRIILATVISAVFIFGGMYFLGSF